MKPIRHFLLMTLAPLLLSAAVQYTYDDAGRLTGVD